MKAQVQKHQTILHQARQIFQIAVSCLQHLHQLKDGYQSSENLGEAIENYKIQLGKYHKILLYELKEGEDDAHGGSATKNQVFSESVLNEHRMKLLKAKEVDNNTENIIEVLLSLRVHALQIAPELRRHLVAELIKSDIFFITNGVPPVTATSQPKKPPVAPTNQFVMDLLDIQNGGLRHAICAMISVIASTARGADYLTQAGLQIVEKVIRILKGEVPPLPINPVNESGSTSQQQPSNNMTAQSEDGSVTQRFCIAILQKMSVKE